MKLETITLSRREFAAGALLGAASLCTAARLAADEAPHEPTFLAGGAQTPVTPAPEGAFLVGPMAESTGVNDDLYARALVLSDGATRLAIVTVDYLGFDFDFNDRLIAAVSEATGIPAGHVMINCSHTHSAPLTVPWGPWEKEKDKPFHRMLPGKLAGVAKEACDQLVPVQLRYRREPAQIGFNRRLLHDGRVVMAPNPKGAVLPWVDVLAAERDDGRRVAVLLSHAAHPVVVHATSRLLSADYPGFAVEHLRKSHGEGCVYLFAQGCCGNVNAFPLQGGLEAAAAVGRDLGTAVGRALDTAGGELEPGALKVASSELNVPLADPPPVAELKKLVAGMEDSPRKARREALLEIARRGRPRTMRYPIRAFAIGRRLCILGLAHEPFAEYHHFVNGASPFEHNMVFGYTNGLHCYVGTEKDYLLGERGGYETSPWGAALMFESRLPLAPQAEKQIRAGILRTLRRIEAQ